MQRALERIREATRGTAFEGRVYLVGGILRDRALGLPSADEIDLVVEGDALALAQLLDRRGLSQHSPVLYPRFGTAMITVGETQVELVTARAESYEENSRKPHVRPATLREDILRRDFTINTLAENLHTGEELDLTGKARADLAAGIIRTPLDPRVTFYDDPLRMLRAVRFAARLGFRIEEETWRAIQSEAWRLNLMGPEPPVVSAERIRDEFLKIILSPDPARGLEMLREGNLLQQFFPELLAMVGVTQNSWHLYDVWEHTLVAMRHLPPDASLELRLGVLLHDIGKPLTRTVDAKGIHFYEHQFVGAALAEQALHRLKLPNDQIRDVTALVRLHMRLGEAQPDWSVPSFRRLIRAITPYTDTLFALARCDQAAMNPDAPKTDLNALRERLEEIDRLANAALITSPLNGREIMAALGIPPGVMVRAAKEYLTDAVIDGRLAQEDKEGARALLKDWFETTAKQQTGGRQMYIVHVFVHVREECVEAFREATVENARNSVQEPGVARFDVVQQLDDPTRFVLVEVYRTEEDTKKHKETAHYQKWRDAVEPMMAEPRRSIKYVNVFPDEAGWG